MDNNSQKTPSNQYPPVRVVFAGGGTGGHLFPAIAIAQEFLKRNSESRILFIGSGRPLEFKVLPELGFTFKTIKVQAIKGQGKFKKMGSMMKVPRAIMQSMGHLKAFNPQIVFGVGGYSAGPVVTAAWMMGIKTAIHEQNILPGMTNRMLAKMVHRIYLSYAGTTGPFDLKKVLITGNPIRKEFYETTNSEIKSDKKSPDFTVFIMGGSQGAHAVNMAVIEALPFLKERERFHFIHQTGAQDEGMVRAAFEKEGISCEVKAFFTQMVQRYHSSDLIIGRAGATTMAEITALGKPSILVPFPYAADNHQELNAKALVDQGAAEMILEKNLNGKDLSERLEFLKENQAFRNKMSVQSKKAGDVLAAEKIVSDCYRSIYVD